MTQHTPGPITLDYEPTGFGGGKLLIDGEHGAELIGTMNGQGGYNYGHELVIRHNAYPAMLEALRKLSADAAIFTRTMPESGGSRAHWSEMRRRLINSNTEVQAVIAAAEGK